MNLRRASNSSKVTLGQLLGSGGEGSVYAVAGAPKLVAKIYKKPPTHAKNEKLRAMVRAQSTELARVSAWPVDTLVDDQGTVRGFLMGRIVARQDAHRLYTPKSRRQTFPDADFRFLVRAATNLARAFAQVHASGHVIGDVNHGNALIGSDGTATLIDCDSFQITDRGRVFSCDVGTPLFTAPELHGKAFRGLRREQAHDDFAFAVLVFHLLFQGRHPFAGRFADPEMTVERAMMESRFVYGANAEKLGVAAPPGALPLVTFGDELAQLFERAFAPAPFNRPTAREWIGPLQRLEESLVPCADKRRHFHPPGPRCCWCEVEASTGARLFEHPDEAAIDGNTATVDRLWQAIEQASRPPKAASKPDFVLAEERADRAAEFRGQLVGKLGSGGIPMALFVLFMFVINSLWKSGFGFISAVAIPASVVAAVLGLGGFWNWRWRRRMKWWPEWQRALDAWRTATLPNGFSRVLERLADQRDQLRELGAHIGKMLEAERQRHMERQRENFLDTFRISQASIADLNPEIVARLARNGIHSAADVLHEKRSLRDAAPYNAVHALVAWAERCALEFRFDARTPEFLEDRARVNEKYRDAQQGLIDALNGGPAALDQERQVIDAQREAASAQLAEVRRKLRRGEHA
jgi:DNA-binding helix-hairpin-helix protein with protein kinase domain